MDPLRLDPAQTMRGGLVTDSTGLFGEVSRDGEAGILSGLVSFSYPVARAEIASLERAVNTCCAEMPRGDR